MGIALLNEDGERVHLAQPASKLVVRISVRAREEVAMPIVGFMMRNHLGVDFSGTNTAREEYELPAMAGGRYPDGDFHLEIPELYPGSFSFSPALADGTLMAYRMCDWIDNAITCQMANSEARCMVSAHAVPCGIECAAVGESRRAGGGASSCLTRFAPNLRANA